MIENNLYSHEFDDEIKAYNAVIKMQEPTSEELKSSFKIIVDMIREKSEIWHGLHGTDVIVEKDAMEDIKEAILALPSLSDTSKYIIIDSSDIIAPTRFGKCNFSMFEK